MGESLNNDYNAKFKLDVKFKANNNIVILATPTTSYFCWSQRDVL